MHVRADAGEVALAQAVPGLAGMPASTRYAFLRKCAEGALANDNTRRALAGEFGIKVAALSRIVNSDQFRAALLTELQLSIDLRGAPAAVNYCIELINDKTAQHKDRLAAAKIILDRSELARPDAAAGASQDLHELTTEQLRRAIEDMESTLAERATPVTAPDDGPDDYAAAINALNT